MGHRGNRAHHNLTTKREPADSKRPQHVLENHVRMAPITFKKKGSRLHRNLFWHPTSQWCWSFINMKILFFCYENGDSVSPKNNFCDFLGSDSPLVPWVPFWKHSGSHLYLIPPKHSGSPRCGRMQWLNQSESVKDTKMMHDFMDFGIKHMAVNSICSQYASLRGRFNNVPYVVKQLPQHETSWDPKQLFV